VARAIPEEPWVCAKMRVNFLMKTMQRPWQVWKWWIKLLDFHFQKPRQVTSVENICWVWPAPIPFSTGMGHSSFQAPLCPKGGMMVTAPYPEPRHLTQADFPWILNPRWMAAKAENQDNSSHTGDGWKAKLSWDCQAQCLTNIPWGGWASHTVADSFRSSVPWELGRSCKALGTMQYPFRTLCCLCEGVTGSLRLKGREMRCHLLMGGWQGNTAEEQ
jgi:hypothetical protein